MCAVCSAACAGTVTTAQPNHGPRIHEPPPDVQADVRKSQNAVCKTAPGGKAAVKRRVPATAVLQGCQRRHQPAGDGHVRGHRDCGLAVGRRVQDSVRNLDARRGPQPLLVLDAGHVWRRRQDCRLARKELLRNGYHLHPNHARPGQTLSCCCGFACVAGAESVRGCGY